MPHSKSKKNKKKPLPKGSCISNGSLQLNEVTDSDRKFQEEVKYCIQILENKLNINVNQGIENCDDVPNDLAFLRNPANSFVKKRQLMRRKFGDYSTLMQEETVAALKDCEDATVPCDSVEIKGEVIRKHTKQENKSSDNTFRFNFDISSK